MISAVAFPRTGHRSSVIPITTESPPFAFLIVGNPGNRRVGFFQKALADAGLPAATLISYLDILEGRTTLGRHLLPETVVRIESPERDFAVEKGLLRHGIADAEADGVPVLSQTQIEQAGFDRGLILHPRQGFLGFRRLLRTFAAELAAAHKARVMNLPADIEAMFDKPQCHQRTQAAGVPVPETLGTVGCYEDLLMRMTQRNMARVFVKLANGSAASGVVALHRQQERSTALTTAEMVRDGRSLKLYNSRRIRCYADERDVKALIDALCLQRVHVERWLPKATVDAQGNFDLRVVVIAGRARHVVMRQGSEPMTNLHLLNRRGDAAALRARMGEHRWAAVLASCEKAMAIFPGSLYAGIDVLIMPGLSRHAILEMNAFGDLLPNELVNGLDTYATELAHVIGEPGA